jgi:hypothetical protein
VLLMLCTPRSTSRRSALDGRDPPPFPASDTARPTRP